MYERLSWNNDNLQFYVASKYVRKRTWLKNVEMQWNPHDCVAAYIQIHIEFITVTNKKNMIKEYLHTWLHSIIYQNTCIFLLHPLLISVTNSAPRGLISLTRWLRNLLIRALWATVAIPLDPSPCVLISQRSGNAHNHMQMQETGAGDLIILLHDKVHKDMS